MPPGIPCAEDGCESARRYQGLDENRALRKYLSDSRLTEVVNPDGRQYTLKHCKELVEDIAAGIEPLEVRRKMD